MAWPATGIPCSRSIAALLEVARATEMPIFFTRGAAPNLPSERGAWLRGGGLSQGTDPREHEIVPALQPRPGEHVVTKTKPSAFYGTPKTITSLKAAVVRLGNHNVARFALASALGGSTGPAWAGFWRHSTAVALLSRHMGGFLESFSRQEEEELFTMGLLHDLGVMVELASGRFPE